jgi:hypothetical protein
VQVPSPILARLMEAAQARALRLASDAVTLEHLLGAALEDEDTAAHQAVVFAFADPETLDQEVLALTDGLMVVGSKAVLPFSTLGIEVLKRARAAASAAGAARVDLCDLVREAMPLIAASAREALEGVGYSEAATAAAPGGDGEPVAPDGPLFRCFSEEAKRALSHACKGAAAGKEASISPARILIGALQAAPSGELAGLRPAVAREALRGNTADPTPPSNRAVPLDPAFELLVGRLGPRADSLDLLLACHREGSQELRAALERHKVTQALLERARGAWADDLDG